MSLLKCCDKGTCETTCTKKVMKFGVTNKCDCLYVRDAQCSFKPKPASTFTELGLSFAARMTNRNNPINGNLDTSSKECVRVNKRRLEGKVDFGRDMGIRLGSKPPQWILTGQTTSDYIRVYAQVEGIETTHLNLVDIDFDTLPDNMYGLYIATNCCGTKGANDGEGGCRTCTAKSGCCDSKTCAAQSSTGAHCQCYCEFNTGGCDEKEICNCTHDSVKCAYTDPVPYVDGCFDNTPRAVKLNDEIRELVVKQVTNAKNGCCFGGWATINLEPQNVGENEPGEFVGMYQWDCAMTLKKLKNNVFNVNPTNVSKGAKNVLEVSEDKLKFEGYANSTVFNNTKLCVIYRHEDTDSKALLVRLNIYIPGTTGAPFRSTCGYNACIALGNGLFFNNGF